MGDELRRMPGMTTGRPLGLLLAGIAVMSCLSCASVAEYRTDVRIEERSIEMADAEIEPAPEETEPSSVRSPVCQDIDLPAYPVELVEESPETVWVRVDFVVTQAGQVSEVEARIEEPTDAPEAFRLAAEEAVSRWRCRPAWRVGEGQDGPYWQPLPYRTSLVFRFDAERVEAEAVRRKNFSVVALA